MLVFVALGKMIDCLLKLVIMIKLVKGFVNDDVRLELAAAAVSLILNQCRDRQRKCWLLLPQARSSYFPGSLLQYSLTGLETSENQSEDK